MKRAIVIRTCGDLTIGNAIANGIQTVYESKMPTETPELKQLQAQLGVSKPVREAYYKEQIRIAKIKYSIKPMSKFKSRMWGLVGLAVLVSKELEGIAWNG